MQLFACSFYFTTIAILNNNYTLPSISFKSLFGVVIGLILNCSTNTFNTLGLTNAGKVGPSRIFFIPRENSVNKIHTAFCSYQERTRERGNSLTLHLKASESANAIFIAE